MEQNEIISAMLDDIDDGNSADAQDKFNELLAQKVSSALDNAKADYATRVYGDNTNVVPSETES